jgi:hypothetical protein
MDSISSGVKVSVAGADKDENLHMHNFSAFNWKFIDSWVC